MSEQSKKISIESSPLEYETHLAESLRKMAIHMENVINSMENAHYIEAWKKAQGIKDSIVYNMDTLNKRTKRMREDNENIQE